MACGLSGRIAGLPPLLLLGLLIFSTISMGVVPGARGGLAGDAGEEVALLTSVRGSCGRSAAACNSLSPAMTSVSDE